MRQFLVRLLAKVELYRLTAISLAGHRYYLLILIAPVWLLSQWLLVYFSVVDTFVFVDVPGRLIGIPLTFLGIFFGLRIIASEINGRTLEIVYTVPGGCEKVWWTKLASALWMLLIVEAVLAVAVWLLFTSFPLISIYYALQPAVFYMVVAMGFATLFRSEVGGAIGAFAVLAFNGVLAGFGNQQVRISPFFNPFALDEPDPTQAFAMLLQNRVGFLLLIFALIGLAFMRSNRREKLLNL